MQQNFVFETGLPYRSGHQVRLLQLVIAGRTGRVLSKKISHPDGLSAYQKTMGVDQEKAHLQNAHCRQQESGEERHLPAHAEMFDAHSQDAEEREKCQREAGDRKQRIHSSGHAVTDDHEQTEGGEEPEIPGEQGEPCHEGGQHQDDRGHIPIGRRDKDMAPQDDADGLDQGRQGQGCVPVPDRGSDRCEEEGLAETQGQVATIHAEGHPRGRRAAKDLYPCDHATSGTGPPLPEGHPNPRPASPGQR